MQARSLISAAVATVTLALSSAAMAGDDHRRHGRDHGPRVERHVDRHIHYQGPRHVQRHVQRDVRIVHRHVHVHPGARWHRGQYLPPQYRQGRYVVTRHQPYLYAPPRGHHWVQVNGEFLLVAAATGLIAHAILSH